MGKNAVKIMDVALDVGQALLCLLVSLGCIVYGQEQGALSVSGQDVNALAFSLAENMEVDLGFRDPFQTSLPRKPVEISMASTSGEPTLPTGLDNVSLRVTGIAWGTDRPRAIINDQVVGIGDVVTGTENRLDKIEVIDISKEGILVKYQNQQFLLKRASGISGSQTVSAVEPEPIDPESDAQWGGTGL